jgi:hypothetical protein
MKIADIGAFVMLACGIGVATAVAAQHDWAPARAATSRSLRPTVLEPHAVLGPATGVYCPDMSEGAFGVHDLGWIPAGLNVEVNVESYSRNEFDPVAGVVVATLGVPGANSIKTATFYDNDSGGGKDVRITFVSPQAGTYVLFVTDNSGKAAGCYRYQASIR